MSVLASIETYYRGIQLREPPQAEARSYAAQVQSGALTLPQVQRALIDAPYTADFVLPVIRVYEASFGRVPEAAVVAYWASIIASGAFTLVRLTKLFAASSEFVALYGDDRGVNGPFVRALYARVLARAPEDVGLAYWVGSGRERWEVLHFLAQSDEFTARSEPHVTDYLEACVAGQPRPAGSLFGRGGLRTGAS
ncbi:DUF4214 domain-containing protein [Alsobacter sp. SYSU BS001988]